MVGSQGRGSLGHVQVGTATVSQQDATGFGRVLVKLAVPCEYLEQLSLEQDETVVVGAPQDEWGEHPRHPSSGETFWLLILRTSAPSM